MGEQAGRPSPEQKQEDFVEEGRKHASQLSEVAPVGKNILAVKSSLREGAETGMPGECRGSRRVGAGRGRLSV